MLVFHFEACLNGFYGPNCMFICPYPYFGRRCLEGPCQCSKENCDAKTGCRSSKKYLLILTVIFFYL